MSLRKSLISFSGFLVEDILPVFVTSPDACVKNVANLITDKFGFVADRNQFKIFDLFV